MKTYARHLAIKRSRIPGAGKGLFTTVEIPKGGWVTEYKGRLQPWKEVKDEDGYNGYIFKLNNSWAINGLHYRSCFGRYANDARGINRAPGCRNNSEFITKGRRCFIATTRKLKAGEEVFVDYGQAYWRLIRRLLKAGEI